MLVKQVTAQIFGNDVRGVEIQLSVEEAQSIAEVIQNGMRDLPNGMSHSLRTQQRANYLLEQLRLAERFK